MLTVPAAQKSQLVGRLVGWGMLGFTSLMRQNVLGQVMGRGVRVEPSGPRPLLQHFLSPFLSGSSTATISLGSTRMTLLGSSNFECCEYGLLHSSQSATLSLGSLDGVLHGSLRVIS